MKDNLGNAEQLVKQLVGDIFEAERALGAEAERRRWVEAIAEGTGTLWQQEATPDILKLPQASDEVPAFLAALTAWANGVHPTRPPGVHPTRPRRRG